AGKDFATQGRRSDQAPRVAGTCEPLAEYDTDWDRGPPQRRFRDRQQQVRGSSDRLPDAQLWTKQREIVFAIISRTCVWDARLRQGREDRRHQDRYELAAAIGQPRGQFRSAFAVTSPIPSSPHPTPLAS